jgi:hypothetical protein
MGSIRLSSQPPKVLMKKENLTASGSAERSQGGSVEGRSMAIKGFASHRVTIPGGKGTIMVAVGCVSHGAVDPMVKEVMVLEVVGGDPEVGTEEVIKASPLRVGTQVAPFSSSVMMMVNIGTARPLRDPWYQMKGLFPAVPPTTSMTVSSMYWVSREFFGFIEEAWIPDSEGLVDLQIKRGVLKPVSLQLEYLSGIVETWVDWVDE